MVMHGPSLFARQQQDRDIRCVSPIDFRQATLAADLASGGWDERHGHFRTAPEYDGALRLVISDP